MKGPVLLVLMSLSLAGCDFRSRPEAEEHFIPTAGMLREELVARIGEPPSKMVCGDEEVLLYKQLKITIINGVVDHFQIKQGSDSSKETKGTSAVKEEKKGISFFDLVSLQKKIPHLSLPTLAYTVRSADGQPVDHSRYVKPGQITVLEFYSEASVRSKAMKSYLSRLLLANSDVAFVPINIVSRESSIPSEFGIESLPDFRVFDAEGKMMGPPTMDLERIQTLIDKARG